MGVSDPIADMLTRIRNANRVHFKYVDVILPRINQNLCKVLKKSGYISGYDVKKDKAGHEVMRVYLKYPDIKRNSIRDIQRISKPGRRIYVKSGNIPKVLDGVIKFLLGYSNPIEYVIPPGIDIKVDKQVNIVVSGIDKEIVGRVAAEIRALKKPEPYKGKGIKYVGERIRRKVGKSVGA